MKCPFCAEDIKDGAAICLHCGKKLRKSPAVAAILNFFFWGAGYLYCGRQWGILILIPYIFLNIIAIATMDKNITAEDALAGFLFGLVIDVLFARHAYRMAEKDWIKLKRTSDKGNADGSGRLKRCTNCGRDIGKLEKAYVFKDQIVCAECHQRLERQK